MNFFNELRWQLKNCWTNPWWYFVLVLFVFGPVISNEGWNPLDWGWWWLYIIFGPIGWMAMAVLRRRCIGDNQ